ncbi:MAG TPA: bifunctional helix-turn-helix transcriptional regulator/GNAT family N-acetyltransferase [Ottowia sp.]|nr:bifunctional helix-turn-helix transcriptional regulator/GNAT family N-acetyltransferase [Ottowia sp.]
MNAAAPSDVDPDDIRAFRAFNRFFTQRIGVLRPYLGSDLSLTEVRLLHDLAHRDGCTAAELARSLALDPGYLSRVLRRFSAKGWLERRHARSDGRARELSLSPAGHAAFEPLQERSRREVAALLAPLTAKARRELIEALQHAQALLDPSQAGAPAPQRTIVLRDPRPGDMGWVIQQHGALYAQEFGWSDAFEALVAEIVAGMMRAHDPAWERGWIAEIDGERVGSVFVVRKNAETAQLRLLLLTPPARGLGLGGRLTDECIAFARAKGYRQLVLWTHANLVAARRIYAQRGFRLANSEEYEAFGQPLVSENWELDL